MVAYPEVSGYRISGELGRGGFAVVYRAEQQSLRREVALKVLSVLDMSPDEIARFERECEALAQLDWHPNILRVLDAGLTAEGRPYLAMELLEAGSVGARHAGRPMPVDEVRQVGLQITSALAAAHDAGILHRDIKPGNILIDRTGRYRLADFGIASIVGATRSSSVGMTGTVGYLAPEVIMGEKATVRSDVYSLAATMHALTTGVPPFSKATDESIAATIARTLHEQPADLRANGAPAGFAAVIAAALAKDPSRRTATAAAFGRQLEQGEAVVLPVAPPAEAPTVVRGAATGVGAAAAQPRPPEPPTPPHATAYHPPADPTVRVNRWPAAPAPVPVERRDRRALVAALVAITVLLFGGVAYGALRSDTDDDAVATPLTTTTELTGEPSATTAAPAAVSTSTDVASTDTAAPPQETTTSLVASEPPVVSITLAPDTTAATPQATTPRTSPVTTAPRVTLPPATLPPATPSATSAPATNPPATTPPTAAPTVPPTAAPTVPPTAAPTVPPTAPPGPVVTGVFGSASGTTAVWSSSAGTTTCQDRETWSFSGPVPYPTRDSGWGYHCWPTHSTTPLTLTPGTWTATLTIYLNGRSASASATIVVPG